MPRSSALDRTQVLPFPDATDLHLRIARCFALINDWNAALNGHFAIEQVVTILTKQVEARNIALYRIDADKPQPIATAARAFDTLAPEHSSGALARYLMAQHPDALTPGSIWRLKDLQGEERFAGSAAEQEWHGRPEIIEMSLIVLEHRPGQLDAIEMIFDRPPRPTPKLPPAIITQAMADAWSLRATGLIGRTIQTYGRRRGARADDAALDVLGKENPYALSRAEQRVCQLLSGATKPKDIAQALHISLPTVRTHLRNLFAKTDTQGQIELIALINRTKGTGG